MTVKVFRFDPDVDKDARFQEFRVPAAADWTAMDVLDYIAANDDSTVAYFRHSACDHGICGRCVLKVNGKNMLACTAQVGDAEELVLEPKSGSIIRDLVTR